MIGGSGELLKRLDPWLSPLAGPVAAALRPRWRPTPAEAVLVVRPGGMGDLILAQLAYEALGVAAEDGTTWLVESRSAAWARHSGLTHVVYDRSPQTTMRAIGGRFRTVVNTEQLFGLSMAAARWAVARRGEVTAFATNRAARQADHLVDYDWRSAPEAEEFGRLLAAATGRRWIGPLAPARRHASDDTWVVSLGGTHSPSRSLSVPDWVAVVDRLAGERDVVLTAGPLERTLAAALLDRLGSRATLFSGDFDDVARRIATAERLIAVDGGPVHIASYYGVPVDAVFTAGRSQKWAPLAPGSVVHRRDDLACQPCTVFGQVPPCPYDYRCRAGLPTSLRAFPVDLPPIAEPAVNGR